MFWRNLNVFVAGVTLLLKVAAGPLLVLLTVPTMLITQHDIRIGFILMPLVWACFPAMLANLWWRRGLSPTRVNPDRINRLRYGHLILAIASFVALTLMAFTFLMIPHVWAEWRPAYNPDQRLYESLVAPVMPIATAAWVVGLLMIFSSRAKPTLSSPGHAGK